MTQGSDGTVSWRALHDEAVERLGDPLDARRIVEECAGIEPPDWPAGLDEAATERAVARFDDLVRRRRAGEPLQYVIGRWAFRTLDLAVDRRALIPRPETEVVAGLAIDAARTRQSELVAGGGRQATVVDLGTGSGAIALSIAAELDRPDLAIWAGDASADAVALARANLAGLGRAGARVRIVEGHWFDALPGELRGRVDVVVSNPPYVAADDELPPVVADWEPFDALVPGPTGYEAYEQIVPAAAEWLAPGGTLVLELAPHQAHRLTRLAVDAGFVSPRIHPDLAGRLRALVAQRRS